MECIEASFNSEEFELKLDKFMHNEMDESEHEEFCVHMMQCEYCHEQVRAQQKLKSVLKIEFMYEELCEAYEKREWQKVFDLAEKMKALGYSEDVHPIKEKVDAAESELKAKEYYDKETDKTIEMISLIIDGKRTDIEWKGDEIFFPIPKESEFSVLVNNEAIIDNTRAQATSVDSQWVFHKKDNKVQKAETDVLEIEINEGAFEFKLTIKPKLKK